MSLRRLVLVLALVVIPWLPGGCGGNGANHLTVSVKRLDFGRVLHGEAVQRSLVVRNGGDQPVVITGVSFNCTCFQTHAIRKMLQPGEERPLTITFISSAVPPERLRGKHMDLTSNDPIQPRIEVALEGEVVVSATVLPPLLDLGTLGDERSRTPRVVKLRPGRGMTTTLLGSRATPLGLFDIEVAEADGGADVSICLRADATGRDHLAGALELKVRVEGEGFAPRELDYVVRIHGEWPPR